MTYTVITKVPPLTDGGNLALPMVPLLRQVEQPSESNPLGRYEETPFGAAFLGLRQPVFQLGEVLRLDHNDRDQFGRKPDKWDIETEEFESADEAFDRAFAVIAEADERSMEAMR